MTSYKKHHNYRFFRFQQKCLLWSNTEIICSICVTRRLSLNHKQLYPLCFSYYNKNKNIRIIEIFHAVVSVPSHLRWPGFIKIMAAPSTDSGMTSALTAPVDSHLRDYTLALRRRVALHSAPNVTANRPGLRADRRDVTVIKCCICGDQWRTGCWLQVGPVTWCPEEICEHTLEQLRWALRWFNQSKGHISSNTPPINRPISQTRVGGG